MALRYATVTGNSLPCCPRVVRQTEAHWHILKMENVTRHRRVSRLATFLVSPVLSKLLFLLQSEVWILVDPMSGIESPTEDLQRCSLITAASLTHPNWEDLPLIKHAGMHMRLPHVGVLGVLDYLWRVVWGLGARSWHTLAVKRRVQEAKRNLLKPKAAEVAIGNHLRT